MITSNPTTLCVMLDALRYTRVARLFRFYEHNLPVDTSIEKVSSSLIYIQGYTTCEKDQFSNF